MKPFHINILYIQISGYYFWTHCPKPSMMLYGVWSIYGTRRGKP